MRAIIEKYYAPATALRALTVRVGGEAG